MKTVYDTYVAGKNIAGLEDFTIENYRLYKMDEKKTLCMPD